MKVCLCGWIMLILVSGSPTQEISIKKRLKQRDPLMPFLFLIFVKGFSGLKCIDVKFVQAVWGGYWRVSHIASSIWGWYFVFTRSGGGEFFDLKGNFEMPSGLKVNYRKSWLIWVNVPMGFMTMACDFLNWSEGVLLFIYLGLPVGENSMKFET